nr:hypothetical protein [Bacilli bacterium]
MREESLQKVSQAIDVLNKATQEPDQAKRIAIAQEAVSISNDCIEAWLFLANEAATDFEQAAKYLTEAVAAGDRFFADKKEEWTGRFWQVAQTRPYMQARAGLGQVLWEIGEHDQALAILEETQRLNPVDHQGIRFILLRAYLERKDYERGQKLASQYEAEQSTPMLYTRLLYTFALDGDSLPARSLFVAARKINPFVLDYLLGLRVLPQKLPKQAEPGQESEAVRYAVVYGDAFTEVEGCIDFLRAQKKIRVQKEEKKKEQSKKS